MTENSDRNKGNSKENLSSGRRRLRQERSGQGQPGKRQNSEIYSLDEEMPDRNGSELAETSRFLTSG